MLSTSLPSPTSPTRIATRPVHLPALALLALSALAAPATADWLVTTDGERIETRGPWRVEGSRVLFNLPNGTLTALRTEQVDLDQSRLASAEQPQPPTQKAGPREPVLVLTDEDVGRAPAELRVDTGLDGASEQTATGDDEAGEGSGAEGAGEATPAATGGKATLEVTDWREETAGTGIRFLGTLDNGSPDFAALLRVEVSLYDEGGTLIDTQPARLGRTSLAPGSSTTFDAFFDGVYAYRDVIFSPDGRILRSRRPATADAATAPEDGAAEASSPEGTSEPPPVS